VPCEFAVIFGECISKAMKLMAHAKLKKSAMNHLRQFADGIAEIAPEAADAE
jgi:hypothetical protein